MGPPLFPKMASSYNSKIIDHQNHVNTYESGHSSNGNFDYPYYLKDEKPEPQKGTLKAKIKSKQAHL